MAPGYFDGAVPPTETSTDLGFTVLQQRVTLNVEFASKTISGTTEITVQPTTDQLKHIRLNCRQARISEARIEGKPAAINYVDPYDKLKVRGKTTVHQHQNLRNKIDPYVKLPPEPELSLTIPSRVRIQELQGDAVLARNALERNDSEYGQGAETPQTAHAQEAGSRFAPLKVFLDFTVDNFRDGIHFVGFETGDSRYPHLYTRNTIAPGSTSSIFPCVDDLNTKCMWEISVRCPKTLGDAFRKPPKQLDGDTIMVGTEHAQGAKDEYSITLSEEERTLDLSVIASADLTDDIIDPQDPTMRTVSFVQIVPVCARHIGFAIGPFEHVDLSEFREMDQDDKLGQNAIHVHGYCLPSRADALRNTCMPMAKAIDDFTVNYGSFPFTNYKMIFVDDSVQDVAHTASLSICSNRLLFPENIIEPLDTNTRILIHALASQYIGVSIIPKEATDLWVITGTSGFMCDLFMKKLAGNNEYRFRQKIASEKVFDQDFERYSIHQLGAVLDIDPSEYDFLALKSPLVLYILDRRLAKASGSAGMLRIINRLILNEKTGELENGEVSTDFFQKVCERLGHVKLDAFFRQWVFGAGCPIFHVSQRFNKKKLVVEMMIQQRQMERKTKPKLETNNFMREVKEQVSEAWAPGVQPVFTGPMTIRIHEADGTPYEHIVEIKDAITKFDVPYNTKYKRLKRSKRAKERAMGNTGPGDVADPDADNDTLLYCLGDVLQSEEEVKDWRLTDWSKEDEDRMGQESYEWIRMDADFEWIGKIQMYMPIYMFVSQLQQDRDVVAQYESLQHVAAQQPHPLMSTILTRTLMDRRYFHGIRTLAAAGLAKCAVESLNNVGLYHLEKAFQEFFCIPDSPMPRANDFSDRTSYIIQSAIPKAMARIRDRRGRVPMRVRRFFVDKLKFNDNSNNEFSDCYYVSTLMTCLADALVASAIHPNHVNAEDYDDDDVLDEIREDQLFRNEAINELERYRRIDEWIASYQNIYSVTAINCMQKLQLAGVIPSQIKQIMMYTQAGNADDVRLKAFAALVDLKVFKQSPNVLKYLLFSISDDNSPYFRDRLTRVLGQALGSIAIAEDLPKKPVAEPVESLVLEQEAPDEVQAIELVGKSPPELALAALKTALKNDKTFQQTLWQVIQSPLLDLSEVVGFLDIAALLYEPSTALMVNLRYPRYKTFRSWESREGATGKKSLVLVLKDTSKFRTTPLNGLGLEAWLLIQQHGLKWTAGLAKEVRDYQKDIKTKERDQKAQIAALQTQIAAQNQAAKSSTAMSPPPLPTPSGSKPGPKLSLKRKQSTTSESERAGSPKRQQFSPPAATPPAATPKTQRSPSVSKSKAPTPAPSIARPTKPKVKKERKTVRLKIANKDRLQSILSKKPRPSLKISTNSSKGPVPTPKGTPAPARTATPSSTAASILPPKSSTGGSDFFSSPAVQSQARESQSLGSFRFYGGGGSSGGGSQATARIKTEDAEPASGISPSNTTWAGKKDKTGATASSGGSGGVPSRSGTPKISLSRPGTPGLGSGGSRAGTPKPLSANGGSRAGTPSGGVAKVINRNALPSTSSTAGGTASASAASPTGGGGNGGEPEKKKLGFKLKLGPKKPPTT